jgi:hypothetical protein
MEVNGQRHTPAALPPEKEVYYEGGTSYEYTEQC